MATQVFTEEEYVLQDGTDVTVRPLVIGRLRRLMKAWKVLEQLAETEDSDDEGGFDVLINCSGIALEHEFKEKFEGGLMADPKDKDKKKVLSDEYKSYLEEVLDQETIYKILEVSANLRLTADPNLIAAAAREAAGTN